MSKINPEVLRSLILPNNQFPGYGWHKIIKYREERYKAIEYQKEGIGIK
ncbi:hypothetical protein [Xanthovirga aplysinae]|nr:hypothetical protein [Xanthovirga aplysinae]